MYNEFEDMSCLICRLSAFESVDRREIEDRSEMRAPLLIWNAEKELLLLSKPRLGFSSSLERLFARKDSKEVGNKYGLESLKPKERAEFGG